MNTQALPLVLKAPSFTAMAACSAGFLGRCQILVGKISTLAADGSVLASDQLADLKQPLTSLSLIFLAGKW